MRGWGGCDSYLASSLAWGVYHWSFLAFGWGWVLVLSWRSLGELLLIDIMWSWEVSGGPVSWTQLSHLRDSGLTPGWSIKTLLGTGLRRKGRKTRKNNNKILKIIKNFKKKRETKAINKSTNDNKH